MARELSAKTQVSREAEDSASLGYFKNRLDKCLSNII